MSWMNAWQRAVCRNYGNGDYKHLIFSPRWLAQLDDVGDTLFTFLMIELSTAEDCEDAETALQRLQSARDDLDLAIRDVMRLIPVN